MQAPGRGRARTHTHGTHTRPPPSSPPPNSVPEVLQRYMPLRDGKPIDFIPFRKSIDPNTGKGVPLEPKPAAA